MKKAPMYGMDGPVELCYQKADIDPNVVEQAQEIWYQEWVRQGKKDHGTCCGGKGLEIRYIAKGKRIADWVNVVNCTWVQGNIAAYDAHAPALEYLKEYGDIEARYNDGWMD
jgi:hypothetical protein